jgi:hypothetical protein
MISAEDAKKDIDKFVAEASGADTKILLRAAWLIIKVVLTARTNTVKIMDKLSIPREEKKVVTPDVEPKPQNK